MTFIIQNFGPNLARLRIEKGVSQTQLAEDLGIGKQSISLLVPNSWVGVALKYSAILSKFAKVG